jgi:hypothetical protein
VPVGSIDQKALLQMVRNTPFSPNMPKMPRGAVTPTLEELPKLIETVRPYSDDSNLMAAYFREDWTTQGDWVGRYGKSAGVLCAAGGVGDHPCAFGLGYGPISRMGPNKEADDSLRGWLGSVDSPDRRAPYDTWLHKRFISEYDDHGEFYPRLKEGPDIWTILKLPEGQFCVTFYFYPYIGHEHALSREYRDLIMTVGLVPAPGETFQPLARCRVEYFQGAVYKEFFLQGGKEYRFETRRNYSYNAIINGIFVDRIDPDGVKDGLRGVPGMVDVRYMRPVVQITPEDSLLTSAAKMWDSISNRLQRLSNREFSVLAYRALASEMHAAALLENWRWELKLWTETDRQRFIEVMNMGNEASKKQRDENARWNEKSRQLDLAKENK